MRQSFFEEIEYRKNSDFFSAKAPVLKLDSSRFNFFLENSSIPAKR